MSSLGCRAPIIKRYTSRHCTDDAMEKNARVIRRMIANEAARREVAAEN
jgi:hypothetical protein